MFYFWRMDDRYFTPPIPNGWFQIAASDEIKPGDVKPLKYFDKDLVIWRSEDGELSVLDAFCPHPVPRVAVRNGRQVHGRPVRRARSSQGQVAKVARQRGRQHGDVLASRRRRATDLRDPRRDSGVGHARRCSQRRVDRVRQS
ncbi:MAG: Rieske (2Fe-2S) protein [Deltaproteobacteria bacterium]|nr:Rieske (2Fe-2S) protein [Deltaproteobacteria bacterium]